MYIYMYLCDSRLGACDQHLTRDVDVCLCDSRLGACDQHLTRDVDVCLCDSPLGACIVERSFSNVQALQAAGATFGR